ncbi:MAG: HupE/UreJ family protein [Pseudomonadota bacterium]
MNPNRRPTGLLLVILALGLVALAAMPPAAAHPEDEFCTPGEDGLDPALCLALSELDNAKRVASGAILNAAGEPRGFWSTFGLYVSIGIGHILPAGLDHILFVLALFLSSTRLKALVIQISAFTVAHTATLGLTAAGLISPPSSIVEALIAASIAFVAIENLIVKDMPRWRPLIVVAFGLVHGMGFAGFFGELGLPDEQFWSGLIGFNVGVEIGQLSIVVVAFVLGYGLRRRLTRLVKDHWYRRGLVVPASLLIGATGLVWSVERTLAALN